MPMASRMRASMKCPMRHLAITGMLTASMMPATISGSLMRATPPCARISAGPPPGAPPRPAPRLFGDAGVLGVDHVHDYPALEHLGEALLRRKSRFLHYHSLWSRALTCRFMGAYAVS